MQKETRATIVAVLLLIAWGIFKLVPTGLSPYQFYEYTIPVRILIAVWIYRICKARNRNELLYSILGFLFPTIVLFIVGQFKGKTPNYESSVNK